MTQIDIKAQLKKRYEADLPNVWKRVQDYYAKIGESSRLDGYVLDPDGAVDFYANYGVAITDFTYEVETPNYAPVIAFDQSFANNTDATDTMTPSFTRSETDAFSFGFNEGLKIGTKATIKVGIPLIADGEAEVSGEISFGSSQQWTKSETQTWASSTTAQVPPHSTVEVKGFIQNATVNAQFRGTATATDGNVLVWFRNVSTGTFTEWPIPVTVLLTRAQRSFPVSGSYTGIEGVLTYWKSQTI
jgi:hypothetical protein